METYTELKNWWLINNRYWFKSSINDDIEISNKCINLLNINFIEKERYNDIGLEEGLGYIILHDQIIRHYIRANNLEKDKINEHLYNILDFVKSYYNTYRDNLVGYEFCFTLLPLRHTNDFNECEFVLNETWNILEKETNIEMRQIYKNYLKATYERIGKKEIIIYEPRIQELNYHDNIKYYIDKYNDILDDKCKNYNNKELERIETNKLFKTCKDIIDITKNYIISISGGVDSMVISWILYKLRVNFVLVHINYNNRKVCEKEKEFLKDWSNYLGVKLFYREITEINRQKCMKNDMRNIYEEYTRNIRMESYINTEKQMIWYKSYIILGHNNDDCIENILTNIATKNKYENLNGMVQELEIDFKENKIKFIRPILTITKKEIYDYAEEFNILYLYDSTPNWSQRGKIRDIVRPCLENWNNNMIEGLINMTNILRESLECVDLLVEKMIERIENKNDDNIIITGNIKYIKLRIEEIKLNKILWDRFFNKIEIKISIKSLEEIIRRYENIHKHFNKIQKRYIYKIQITKEKRIYYWKTDNNKIILGFEKS